MLIDLHVHTYMSDGQHSPGEVVSLARSKGVGLLSVTDHDTLDGLEEAETAARQMGIGFIPGIEISVTGARELHILGYYIDRSNEGLIRLNEEFTTQRMEREERIYKYLRERGVDISRERLRRQVKGKIVSRTHFARALVEDGYARDFADAFERYLSTPEFQKLERPKASPERGIKLIREAGGVAVMAHPSTLRLSPEDLDAMVGNLANLGLKGMECHYSAYGKDETGLYASIAKKHGLAVTGGSDFHGEKVKKGWEIGTGINGSLLFEDGDIGRRLFEMKG